MIPKQASARHFWVFLSKFSFSSVSRKIGKLERKMLENYSQTPHWIRYFVYLSWVSPCWEQMLAIGVQAMCIACNDTSVIVINFRKSNTHAITDTYCTLNFQILPTFRSVHPFGMRSNTQDRYVWQLCGQLEYPTCKIWSYVHTHTNTHTHTHTRTCTVAWSSGMHAHGGNSFLAS